MGKPENICIIDDDPIFIYGTRRLIKEAHFEGGIMVYSNGQEAYLYIKEQLQNDQKIPPVIFLDLNMPIMNGWEFLDEIHKIPELTSTELSIYILSSSIDPRDSEKAKTYSLVKGFISKPISVLALEGILAA
jgi:CheY-like chemotaxis protein